MIFSSCIMNAPLYFPLLIYTCTYLYNCTHTNIFMSLLPTSIFLLIYKRSVWKPWNITIVANIFSLVCQCFSNMTFCTCALCLFCSFCDFFHNSRVILDPDVGFFHHFTDYDLDTLQLPSPEKSCFKEKSRVQNFISIKDMASDVVTRTSWPTGHLCLEEPEFPWSGWTTQARPVQAVVWHHLVNSCSLEFSYQRGQEWTLRCPSRTATVGTEISRLVGARFVSQIWGNRE